MNDKVITDNQVPELVERAEKNYGYIRIVIRPHHEYRRDNIILAGGREGEYGYVPGYTTKQVEEMNSPTPQPEARGVPRVTAGEILLNKYVRGWAALLFLSSVLIVGVLYYGRL